MSDVHECEVCGVQYVTYASYVNHDPCYAAAREARRQRELEANGWSGFDDDDEVAGTQGRHYGKRTVEQADAPTRGPATTTAGATTSSPTGATEKQRAFIERLAHERGVEVQLKWVASKASASQAIDDLLAMPRAAAPEPGTPAVLAGASPKQTAFLTKLAGERGVELKADWLATKAAASAAIDALMAMPKVKAHSDDHASAQRTDLQRGQVHLVDGVYYRVHVSQRTGGFYAAEFNVDEQAFTYARGAIAKLTEANKVTPEQAAAFGAMYGRCVFCSKAIDTPESTAVGYGPICAAKHGLPWGEAIPAGGLDEAPF